MFYIRLHGIVYEGLSLLKRLIGKAIRTFSCLHSRLVVLLHLGKTLSHYCTQFTSENQSFLVFCIRMSDDSTLNSIIMHFDVIHFLRNQIKPTHYTCKVHLIMIIYFQRNICVIKITDTKSRFCKSYLDFLERNFDLMKYVMIFSGIPMVLTPATYDFQNFYWLHL